MAAEAKMGGNWSALLRESGLVAGAITAVLFFTIGDAWTSDLSDPWWSSILFVWLFAVMLWCVFGVVHHAEALALLLGEPYGTLILTIAVIGIEASLIAAIMLSGDANPTLARDTMFAIYMIVLNGLVGLSLLLGGLRHIEQDYNLQGANAFLAVIVPLSVIALPYRPRRWPTRPHKPPSFRWLPSSSTAHSWRSKRRAIAISSCSPSPGTTARNREHRPSITKAPRFHRQPMRCC